VPSQCRVSFYINYILCAMRVSWFSSVARRKRSEIIYLIVYPVVDIIIFIYTHTCLLYSMSLPRRKTSNLSMGVVTYTGWLFYHWTTVILKFYIIFKIYNFFVFLSSTLSFFKWQHTVLICYSRGEYFLKYFDT